MMNVDKSDEDSVIKIPSSIGSHLRLAWGNDMLSICHDSNEKKNEFESNDNLILTAQWYNKMTTGHVYMRELTVQSYHIFESIQQIRNPNIEILLTKSLEYRATLKDYEEKLEQYVKQLEGKKDTESENYAVTTVNCNTLKDYHMLWHLVEILFIRPTRPGNLMQELLHWLNLQIPNTSRYYAEFLKQHIKQAPEFESIERSDAYWPVIIGLCLQGRHADLYTMLGYHSCANGSAIRKLRDIIQIMPMKYVDEKTNIMLSDNDINRNWLIWKHQLKMNLIENNLLLPFPELQILVRIMMGKELEVYAEDIVLKLTDGCWYYAFISYLLYSKPAIAIKELPAAQIKFKAAYRNLTSCIQDEDSTLALLITAIMELDMGQFIAVLSETSSSYSSWLLAHLIDLLHRAKPRLFVHSKPQESSLAKTRIFTPEYIAKEMPYCREFFITDYVQGLVNGPGMLVFALNYCLYCPVTGKGFIEAYIDSTYFPTDKFTMKIYKWCIANKLGYIAKNLAFTKCVEHFKQNRYGNSIYWCQKCDDDKRIPFLNRIASLVLEKMLNCNVETKDGKSNEWNAEAVDEFLESLCDEHFGVKKMVFLQKWYLIKKTVQYNLGDKSSIENSDDLDESIVESNRINQLKLATESLRDLSSSKLVCNEIMAICLSKLLPELLLRDRDVYRGIFDLATVQELLDCVYLASSRNLGAKKPALIKLLLEELAYVSTKQRV